MTKWLKNILVIIVLLLVIIFILRKTNLLPSFKDIFVAKPVVIDNTPILIKDIKQLGQLISITVYDEVVMDSTKYEKPNVVSQLLQYAVPGNTFLNVDKVVLIAKGKVIAGTDLQKITDKDIIIDKDSVALKLPAAEILDVIVNPSDVTTFSETGTWSPDEIAQVKSRIKTKLVQRSMAQDVINKANVQGLTVMENFLRTLGFRKVAVKINN